MRKSSETLRGLPHVYEVFCVTDRSVIAASALSLQILCGPLVAVTGPRWAGEMCLPHKRRSGFAADRVQHGRACDGSLTEIGPMDVEEEREEKQKRSKK